MAWRVATSLNVLLEQLNRLAPRRSKVSDGSIGDTAHANRTSDHNPWYGPGIVTARDFTHDPTGGLDCHWLAAALVKSRDPRIKYIIWNRMIWSGGSWRRYTGVNPHTHHLHLSVVASPAADSPAPWNLGGGVPVEDDMPTAREVADELLNTMLDMGWKKPDGSTHKATVRTVLAWSDLRSQATDRQVAALAGEVAGLRAAVQQIAADEDIDTAAVFAAAEAGTKKALAENTVNVDIDIAGPNTEGN